MDRFDLCPETTYLVGDSVRRDVALAARVGLHPVWARYGLEVSTPVRRMIDTLAPWQGPPVTDLDEPGGVVVLDRFADVRAVLESFACQGR